MKSVKEMIEVMTAFEQGKEIECHMIDGGSLSQWSPASTPCWNWKKYDYRIKKEPSCRSYNSIRELMTDYLKRFNRVCSEPDNPFIWVKSKDSPAEYLITGFNEDLLLSKTAVMVAGKDIPIQDLFTDYTYLDGSPCGVEEVC